MCSSRQAKTKVAPLLACAMSTELQQVESPRKCLVQKLQHQQQPRKASPCRCSRPAAGLVRSNHGASRVQGHIGGSLVSA